MLFRYKRLPYFRMSACNAAMHIVPREVHPVSTGHGR
jgi:hypothetical protein